MSGMLDDKLEELSYDFTKFIFDRKKYLTSRKFKKHGLLLTDDEEKLFVGELSFFVFAYTIVIENGNFITPKTKLSFIRKNTQEQAIKKFISSGKSKSDTEKIQREHKALIKKVRKTWDNTQDYPQPCSWYISKDWFQYLSVDDSDELSLRFFFTERFAGYLESTSQLLHTLESLE